ncbi:integrase family protein [uncultured Pseudoteredinibacter sp.]|uniref:tyrosine-type recombinase/integrase n=1 Tax=uncultured Pseudoteredinibacter sp. TaxID=1641701 RepID=UPI0026269183|nr:integrase family protein [uncultured Pseudoteredinibacter sp.]
MAKLTKSYIDRLPLPPKKPNGAATQSIYRDDAIPGFGILVGSGGTKSFFIEKRINGRVKRMSLGRYGHLTPTQARSRAMETLGEIATGKDPVAQKKVYQAQQITLLEAFEDYLDIRKDLKPGTINNYRKCLDGCLKDWQKKRLADISKDQVEERHREIGQRAPARANNTMRVLRAVFNHAIAKFEDEKGKPLLSFNPVDRLSQNRAWYRIERRRSFIKSNELKDWYEATLNLENEVSRDYLHFVLLTGLRKMEAAKLTWENIDFKDKSLTIHDTKNKMPHSLPLTDHLMEILIRRKACTRYQWVFPSPVDNTHLREPRGSIKQVSQVLSEPFTLHDLRRTFITIAESLDIPAYALKQLLNHKDPNDVTAGYIIASTERIREPMNKISRYIVDHWNNGALENPKNSLSESL